MNVIGICAIIITASIGIALIIGAIKYNWRDKGMSRAYRKIRRVRQRESKRMNKLQKAIARIEMQIQPFDWEAYVNPYHQVPEAERIRQANEYWRQSNDLH